MSKKEIEKLFQSLKAPINEAKEYSDSVSATDDMDKIESLLKKPELMAWAKETDHNYSTKTEKFLKLTQKAYAAFYDEMLKAE